MKGVAKTARKKEDKKMGRNSKDNSLARYEELIKISVRYNDYLRHQMFRIGLSPITHKPTNEASRYVFNVRRVLNELSKENREIIVNEFFSEKTNSNWWNKYYSSSTYYRKRYFAIKSFMEIYTQ